MRHLQSLSILFLLVISSSLTAQTVERLVLIDASTDSEIVDMNVSGDSIDLNEYPYINFRAVTKPEPLASGTNCSFSLTYPSGTVYTHSEGTAVYACFGDDEGNYHAWQSALDSTPAIEDGIYSLKVTPGSGTPSTWTFNIIMDSTDNQELPSDTLETEGEVFIENDGYVVIDMESVIKPNPKWSFKTGNSSLGSGFLQYDGPNSMSSESAANRMEYKVQINNPGTYQFLWRSQNGFTAPALDAENDSWLRLEAADFYGIKAGNKVGFNNHFIKVYVQKYNFDFGCYGEHSGLPGYKIYAQFDDPGDYLIEVSGRSKGHIIDRMVLFKSDKKSIATSNDTPESPMGIAAVVIPDIIVATELYVGYDSLMLEQGDVYKLKGGVLPANAIDTSVIWESSNPDCVSVSDGLLTALTPGSAAITVTSVSGGFMKQCLLTVIPYKPKYEIAKTGITAVYADSENTGRYRHKEFAVDGDINTFWLTARTGDFMLPHEIHFEFDSLRYIDVLDYYPRQDEDGPNGAIGKYEIYVSFDGTDWGAPFATGEMKWPRRKTKEESKEKKRIFLDSTALGKFIKLKALTEAKNLPNVQYSAIAELDFFSYELYDDTTSNFDRTDIVSFTDLKTRVYPNPANEILTIESRERFNTIFLLSIDGRIVKQRNVGQTFRTILDISDLERGSYVLLIKKGTQILHQTGMIKL